MPLAWIAPDMVNNLEILQDTSAPTPAVVVLPSLITFSIIRSLRRMIHYEEETSFRSVVNIS